MIIGDTASIATTDHIAADFRAITAKMAWIWMGSQRLAKACLRALKATIIRLLKWVGFCHLLESEGRNIHRVLLSIAGYIGFGDRIIRKFHHIRLLSDVSISDLDITDRQRILISDKISVLFHKAPFIS